MHSRQTQDFPASESLLILSSPHHPFFLTCYPSSKTQLKCQLCMRPLKTPARKVFPFIWAPNIFLNLLVMTLTCHVIYGGTRWHIGELIGEWIHGHKVGGWLENAWTVEWIGSNFLGVETSSHLGVYIMLIYLLVSPLFYSFFVLSIYPQSISDLRERYWEYLIQDRF